jgi:hypothetical protein
MLEIDLVQLTTSMTQRGDTDVCDVFTVMQTDYAQLTTAITQ